MPLEKTFVQMEERERPASGFLISRRILVTGMLVSAAAALAAQRPAEAAEDGLDLPPDGFGYVHAVAPDGTVRLVTVERGGKRIPVIARLR